MKFGQFNQPIKGDQPGSFWTLAVNLEEILLFEFKNTSSGPMVLITFKNGMTHTQYIHGIDSSDIFKKIFSSDPK